MYNAVINPLLPDEGIVGFLIVMERKKRKRITNVERIQFEALYNCGKHTMQEIARIMNRSDKTLYRELKKGQYMHTNPDLTETMRYSSDKSRIRYEKICENCGRPLKIGNDHKLVSYLTRKIKEEHYSPAAALASIKRDGLSFKTEICLRTIYNYIYSGMVFLNVGREDLPQKPEPKTKKGKVLKRLSAGKLIDKRPEHINSRESFGNWEMDTVVSCPEDTTAVLAMTERKTRGELLFRIPSHEAAEPVRILDRLERELGTRAFRTIFRSITVDNGTENQNYIGLERSVRNQMKRTEVYYCHPYSPAERGSNENQNKLVRRFIPKGSRIGDYSKAEIQKIEKWMNTYPRKMFDWKTSYELLCDELKSAVGYVPLRFRIT